MSFNEDINFVNRTEELSVLLKRIYPSSPKNTITFLRAPSGFGKTRLTDRLIEALSLDELTCIVVDPSIRSKSRSDRIYAWFFVQRAAEPSAMRNINSRVNIPVFAQFVRRKKYSKINWKHIYENLKEIASLSKASRFVIELLENLTKTGRYNPNTILQDDGHFATQLAQDYVLALAGYGPTIFVIRECQNIDPESLRFFLTLGEKVSNLAIILEYTAVEGHFSSEHEKIILDTVTDENSLMIFNLVRLDIQEFRSLLRKYVSVDKKIETDVELSWDGNLRIIKELKYRLMIGSTLDTSKSLLLPTAMKQNLELLPKRRKTILAIIAAHVEAIRFDTLLSIMQQVEPKLTAKKLDSELKHLATKEQYIQINKLISLTDEDLMEALATSNRMKPLVLLAEAKLREFYLDVVRGKTFTSLPLPIALRQAVALCARTGDIVALQDLVKILDSSVMQAVDQALYINIVAGVILSREDLTYKERQRIVDWAIAAAYEVGDYPTTVSLLETIPNLNSYQTAMLACCYSEMNRNAEALELAHLLEKGRDKTDQNIILVAKLIKCASLFALGLKDESSAVHMALRANGKFLNSSLFGFVLRYTEIVKDFPECTSDVLKSAEILRSHKFLKAASYSQLAAAMHLAYAGNTGKAKQLILDAETNLLSCVRDRQIILNNSVVVDLLSEKPETGKCLEKLNTALFTVRDEFSRLTLYNNRLICFWLQQDINQAFHCISIIESIFKAPDFGNRDIFRTVCFNVSSFLEEIGEVEISQKFKSFLLDLDLENSCYKNYWKVRYGLSAEAEPEFNFLLQFKYHPAYLSHWLIDYEGLSVLKEEHVQ